MSYLYSYTNARLRKASSKADVFEAKVASAVDQNSSDSEETFVYDSNPPDLPLQRSRHHSRTPSMTSVTSAADLRTSVRDAHKIAGKKSSMKFATSSYNLASDGLERDQGMRGASGRTSGGGSLHHHHMGRHGQGRGAFTQLLADSDSSQPQSSKPRLSSSRQPSRPPSPKFNALRMGNANGHDKSGEYSAYDLDTEGADDERTPLMSTVRTPRSRPVRRPGSSSLRQLEHQRHQSAGWCRRFAGCLVLSVLLLVLVFSAVGLVFATTKPLYALHVTDIQNVIATQEEMMLDLLVEAVNPNIIGVTVADMDVNIFAKSKHVGSDRWWREHGGHRSLEDWQPLLGQPIGARDNVDEGTDPIEDPEVGEPRTMLLGRIFHFDSPLNFDGSFFKRHPHSSLGEVRLAKPGNKTEAGDAERWEEVLQYPFELIVRGVLQYQLPLSTRDHTVAVTGSYFYEPDKEKQKTKTPGDITIPEDHVSLCRRTGRWDARGRLLALSRQWSPCRAPPEHA